VIDNAVAYARELVAQGVAPPDAVAHTTQRYGISAEVLGDRLSGRVADPETTREALALVRQRFVEDSDAHPDEALLVMLYEAITGEALPIPGDERGVVPYTQDGQS
jgi:hypothetical protein